MWKEERMQTFENFLLDLDDTLIDFHACERAAFQKAFDCFQLEYDEQTYQTYSRINLNLWEQYEKGEIPREAIFKTRYVKLFENMQIDKDGEAFEKIYQSLLAKEHFLIKDALEVVQYLYKKYNLYVVTNGVASTQMQRLRDSGLSIYMKKIFISEEVGYQKPRLEFFAHCFKQIGSLNQTKTIILGDSLSSDILGGNNAGISICWYNPRREKNSLNLRIDYEITDLKELYQLF